MAAAKTPAVNTGKRGRGRPPKSLKRITVVSKPKKGAKSAPNCETVLNAVMRRAAPRRSTRGLVKIEKTEEKKKDGRGRLVKIEKTEVKKNNDEKKVNGRARLVKIEKTEVKKEGDKKKNGRVALVVADPDTTDDEEEEEEMEVEKKKKNVRTLVVKDDKKMNGRVALVVADPDTTDDEEEEEEEVVEKKKKKNLRTLVVKDDKKMNGRALVVANPDTSDDDDEEEERNAGTLVAQDTSDDDESDGLETPLDMDAIVAGPPISMATLQEVNLHDLPNIENQYLAIPEVYAMSGEEKVNHIRCLMYKNDHLHRMFTLAKNMVRALESNMTLWHERLTDKENETSRLNKEKKEMNESFKIEWRRATNELMLTNTAANSSQQKYFYEHKFEARVEENKSTYDKNVTQMEKDRRKLVKENKKLVRDAKNREIAHNRALTVERKRVLFLAKEFCINEIPSYSSNPDDDEVIKVTEAYADLLDNEEESGDGEFQVVVDPGEAIEFGAIQPGEAIELEVVPVEEGLGDGFMLCQ